jgi:hypothetical protein
MSSAEWTSSILIIKSQPTARTLFSVENNSLKVDIKIRHRKTPDLQQYLSQPNQSALEVGASECWQSL